MNGIIAPITYIERKPNSDQYRVVGKGVTVDFLALFVDDPEWPVARICREYGLTPSEVYAAWSFYFDHKVEIDARLDSDAATDHDAAADIQARYDSVRKNEK